MFVVCSIRSFDLHLYLDKRRDMNVALLGGLNHRFKRRLGPILTIKQQRIIGPASHRPVVLPRLPIMNAPKRHAADVVTVFVKEREELGVTLRQNLLH